LLSFIKATSWFSSNGCSLLFLVYIPILVLSFSSLAFSASIWAFAVLTSSIIV